MNELTNNINDNKYEISYSITIICNHKLDSIYLFYTKTNTWSEIHHGMTNCREIEQLDKR
jgi:hypothetical protein